MSSGNSSPSPGPFERGLSLEAAGTGAACDAVQTRMMPLPELPETQADEDEEVEPGTDEEEWEEIEIDLAHLNVKPI